MKHLKSLFLLLLVAATLSILSLNSCDLTNPPGDNRDSSRVNLFVGTADAFEVKGATFPPKDIIDYRPDGEDFVIVVPDGPKVGELKPTNPETKIDRSGSQAPLIYEELTDLDSTEPQTSLCCPEVSVAESNDIVMLTGNFWMSFSTDGGATFTDYNPTTIFPNSDGGFCCDQVLQYVPQFDMFFWLLQYRRDADGRNRLRLAAQTTAELLGSNGTAWTYWDFPSSVFSESGWVDYNDMSFTESSIYFNTNTVGVGRHVVRIPLAQLAAKGGITYSYTPATDFAYFSHITQNSRDGVYWGGHINNSELRVYSLKDGDGFYSWRSVNVDSWPNEANSSSCPDGTDWLQFDAGKNYIFGNVAQGNDLWFAWLASANDNFPQPHVQMVKINTNSWTKTDQVQIWNSEIAFGYPYLSTNAKGEIGMSVGFGGPKHFASHAVGVWGDFVVYYPKLSTRCTNRWGDYNTARRSGSDGDEWVAGGYINSTDAGGNDIAEPHFIRFARP